MGPIVDLVHDGAAELAAHALHAGLAERGHYVLLEGAQLLCERRIAAVRREELRAIEHERRCTHLRVVAPPGAERLEKSLEHLDRGYGVDRAVLTDAHRVAQERLERWSPGHGVPHPSRVIPGPQRVERDERGRGGAVY